MPTAAGIDPGLGGCLALIASPDEVQFFDTPIFDAPKAGRAKKGAREPDPAGMWGVLKYVLEMYPGTRAALEHVQAFPKNGSIGNFKMGQGFGLWQMALAGSAMPHILVRPQRWKKSVLDGAPKTPQGEAAVAARLYPAFAHMLKGPKGGILEGRVDALLIAHFALRYGP